MVTTLIVTNCVLRASVKAPVLRASLFSRLHNLSAETALVVGFPNEILTFALNITIRNQLTLIWIRKIFPLCMEDEGMKKLSHKYANAALSYLSQQGHDFNLVLADYYQPAVVGGGVRIHHNFQAKRPNDPPQLTETFFCQLFYHRGRDYNLRDLTVECCVSLGRSDSLPKKRDNYGCGYCTIFTYHPKNGCDGLIWGRSGQ
ncbi:uncharacterized protein LOC141657278 isoform X4 [Silene latifolia]|uniref:uncharacterized protein LOC141657278 isoform X4 n=1 Tax=Silene latifolia TaxID=37657 RepID=UPI003D781547